MNSTPKKFTAVLAGSVVLASAAYGVGTQVDDGSATAAGSSSNSSSDNRRGGPAGRDLSGLAKTLGVSEAKLRAALEDLRGDRPARARGDLAAALAKELGVSETKVQDVLESARPERPRDQRRAGHRRLAAALAKELGIDASKVRSALADAKRDRGGPPSLDGLAEKLGVSEAKLCSALEATRPTGGPRRGMRIPKRLVSALAKGLDKDASEVRAALRKVRAAKQKEHSARRDEFAQKLADKLGISVDKVKSALPAGGPGHHGRGGPGGPGGPPPGGPGF